MNPAVSLGLREFFFFIFFFILPSPAVTTTSDGCERQSCGGVSIEYPFWLSGRQPSYCGLPPFEVTCRNRTGLSSIPVIGGLNADLYVKGIFYDNQSLRLTSARFADDVCPFPYFTNYTAGFFPFSPANSSNKRIFFLVNCSASANLSSDPYQSITCPPLRKPAYFAGVPTLGESELEPAARSCVLVEVPTVEYAQGNYSDLLRAGWLMSWIAPNCAPCKESGGQCGYNVSQGRFMCICGDRNHRSSCSYENGGIEKNQGIEKKYLIAAVAAPVGFLALASAMGILFYKHKKRRQYLSESSKFTDDIDIDDHFQTHIFSYNELKEATECFHSSKELGDGGFGTVYKGKLRDGRLVAVKRLFDRNYKRVEQFINEVEILSRHRHQNLVSLYGCTSHRSPELLLVYEFVSNGTVADHLHGDRAHERILTWPLRLSIAIETADALRYLHAIDPPIIHRDIKTTNILLDCSFRVKVGDFGLSRFFPANATHVSTTPQGTPGYVDPEYHQHFQLTEKSDVYSYGVVLVELISSKPAVDISRQRSEIKLASMAVAKIQNHELDDLVDRELWDMSDEMTRRMIAMVAELAFRCLQAEGDMRPSMNEVLEELRAVGRGKEDVWIKDDAALPVKNHIESSPDTVAGKWLSQSTTPNNSG